MIKQKILSLAKSNFAIVYYFDIIAKAITLLLSIVIIRHLTVLDYAQYTLFYSIGSFVPGVLGSGIALAYTRHAVMLRERQKYLDGQLFVRLKLYMSVLAILIVIVSLVIYIVFDNYLNVVHLSGIFWGVISTLYVLDTVFFQAREKYICSGILVNIKNLIIAFPLLFMFWVERQNSLCIIINVYLVATVVAWLGVTIYVSNILRHEHERFVTLVRKEISCIEMLKDSIWTVLYMCTISAFNQTDVMLLTRFCSADEVAIYGVANKYYLVVISLLPALLIVLRVKYSKGMIANNIVQRKNTIKTWLKISSLFAILLIIIGSISSMLLFPFLNGEEYNKAITTFNILLVGASLSYMTAPNVGLMVSSGKQKFLFYLSLGAFLLNFIGNLMFIPLYGANAAAFTTILAHFFLNGGSTVYLLLEKDNTRNYL